MSDDNQPKTDVIFLFGAGASVDAGIPDTYKFVVDFEDYIKEYQWEFYNLLLTIIEVREEFNEKVYGKKQRQVDVEQLLEILRRLIEKEKDPILDFYEEKKFRITTRQSNFVELKRLLENFIREKAIIKDESKLEYLKELLNFNRPIEIFSTNYDTCIEQLSHINHMRYTDGFDIYWNPRNFRINYDIKHYKMHGSVIWYENVKTKECVKIPVHSFSEGEPIALKLIYGDDVKPLVIYPAQKAEYVEPLTDLQLMFKERLFDKKTKYVIVVGYSFRDAYIVHMLWDAARINEDLKVLLIAPNAQRIFENKLKYINKEKNDLSRIHDRVVCVPYPFSTIINQLRNHYLNKLNQLRNYYKQLLDDERIGREPNWSYSIRFCIEIGYLTKAEEIIHKSSKQWKDLEIGTPSEKLLLGFKGLLHSVICKDGYEEKWLKRVNESLKMFSTEKFDVVDSKGDLYFLGLRKNGEIILIGKFLKDWIHPLISEKKRKIELLSPKFESALKRIRPSLERFEEFSRYLDNLSRGVRVYGYKESKNDSAEVKSFLKRFEIAKQRRQYMAGEPNSIILGIERGRLKTVLGAKSFEFKLSNKKGEE